MSDMWEDKVARRLNGGDNWTYALFPGECFSLSEKQWAYN